MKFACLECGHRFTVEGQLIAGDTWLKNETTGEIITGFPARIGADCPQCGANADALDEVIVERGGMYVTGFADTPEQVAVLYAAIEELRGLSADAGFAAVIDVLEKRLELSPLVKYLRRHHIELSALGLSFLSVVISLLAWLVPRAPDDQPPAPPPGITRDQMNRLIRDFEAETQQDDRQQKPRQGDKRPHDDERQMGGPGEAKQEK